MSEPKVYASTTDGHRAMAVRWDGTDAAADEIKLMTGGQATLDRRRVMGYIVGAIRRHVPVGSWVIWDREVVAANDAQFRLLYIEVPPAPPPIVLSGDTPVGGWENNEGR